MINDIINGKQQYFADGVQSFLRAQENRQRVAVLKKGNLVNNVRVETRGVCARVHKNGVYGFSSMAEFTADAAETVLKKATENALFLAKHSDKGNIDIFMPERKIITPHRNIVDTEQKRIIDTIREVDDYVAKTYPDLTNRDVIYTEDSQDKIIYTSDASNGHVVTPRCYIYVFMYSETTSGLPIQLFKVFGGGGSFEDYFASTEWMHAGLEELHKRLMDKKEGVFADAGLKTVIIGGELAGMLAHEAVGHTVEADLVRNGAISGKCLNKRVGSELVNLVDFANTDQDGNPVPLPVFLDDEGTPATDAVLIKDGILTGYMNDRETSAEFGMPATGNARGWEFSDEPIIRMRNTAILPGRDNLEEMIASVDDGYYLLETGNGQADLTGEFMFGINLGYEIKNGKLGKAILDTTVSGVAFEMLKTVDMVSSNMHWNSSGFCGKKQRMAVSLGGPEIRCKIMIGGR